MAFSIDGRDLSRIITFKQAEEAYNSITPIRGTINTRPLGARTKRHTLIHSDTRMHPQIHAGMRVYYVTLFGYELVRYWEDGLVEIGFWDSVSTRNVTYALTHVDVKARRGVVYVRQPYGSLWKGQGWQAIEGSRFAMRLKDDVLQVLPECVVQKTEVLLRADQASALRAKYKPLRKYLKQYSKLKGDEHGLFMNDEWEGEAKRPPEPLEAMVNLLPDAAAGDPEIMYRVVQAAMRSKWAGNTMWTEKAVWGVIYNTLKHMCARELFFLSPVAEGCMINTTYEAYRGYLEE